MPIENRTVEPVDREVGARVRYRRRLLGISQAALGELIGVTFQQVQKYERGTNRIGSSRLQNIAVALGVPVGALFGDGPDDAAAQNGGGNTGSYSKDAIELNKAFARIKDLETRQRFRT